MVRNSHPTEEKDWKSYKRLVAEYAGLSDIYENIDLLFFAQWPESRFAKDNIYCKMNNHAELRSLFRESFGDNQVIKESKDRYQKRADLIGIVRNANSAWFDENNFMKYIELFSNNQILYQFLRCDAVHTNDFPLFNTSYKPETKKITYIDNHQITRTVLLETVKNIIDNLASECTAEVKWPYEL